VTEPDVVVVGAGIIGLAAARELLLRRPDRRVVVLDQEPEVGAHQSSHNSGVIHAGVYYQPGSLKARLCRTGAQELYEFCAEHGIATDRCGKLIIAASAEELPRLDAIEARARANGVPGLRRLRAEEIGELEPHATGAAALHSPHTGIVDFQAVARELADEVRARGGEIVLGCRVDGVVSTGSAVTIRHSGGALRPRTAIFCAGLSSDRLAVAAGAQADPRIIPFRGAFLRLAPHRRQLVRGLIYPVPDPRLPFLGVHLTRRIDGEVLLGPTALLVGARDAYRLTRVRLRDLAATLGWPGTWRMARRFWRVELNEVRLALSRTRFAAEAARYVPELSAEDMLPGPVGVRAQGLGRDGTLVDDFVVSRTGSAIHVRNAPSPAATSSLALARLIVDHAEAL
jgi:L-2-hydroxyglutarate oxidase